MIWVALGDMGDMDNKDIIKKKETSVSGQSRAVQGSKLLHSIKSRVFFNQLASSLCTMYVSVCLPACLCLSNPALGNRGTEATYLT